MCLRKDPEPLLRTDKTTGMTYRLPSKNKQSIAETLFATSDRRVFYIATRTADALSTTLHAPLSSLRAGKREKPTDS